MSTIVVNVLLLGRLSTVLWLLGTTKAQESGWSSGQVNTTMCLWQLPRAAVVRDTLYIDGGFLYWKPGMSDGTYGQPMQDGNPLGLIYTLNFSEPFSVLQNLSSVLGTISKAPGGAADNGFDPQYLDGAMFANDGQFFTFGGTSALTDAYAMPSANSLLSYRRFWYGAAGTNFIPGFVRETIPATVNEYVTSGAGVSVPSENLGFYFGGLRSSSSGPIYLELNETDNADSPSNFFVTLDMTNQVTATWTNQTLPGNVLSRANAELVWVPVGSRGILVAIGGVVDPEFATLLQLDDATQQAASQAISPGFMTSVSVYDINSEQWYVQNTLGDPPPQLTQGCTVISSAEDGSSHNIYWYGGFNGYNSTMPFSDDVWILSVPAFMWMKVSSGSQSHGRSGHRCFKPYPDQMLVVGGYTSEAGNHLTCLEGGVVQLFNLSSTTWMTAYDPDVWANYSVPPMIYEMIGGSGHGGGTEVANWTDQSLASIFATPYPTSKIHNWFPYTAGTASNTQRPAQLSDSATPDLPSWVAPVLGTVLGLAILTALSACLLVYRRRRTLMNAANESDGTSDVRTRRTWSWARGHYSDVKSPTSVSEQTLDRAFEDKHESPESHTVPPNEVEDCQIYEMPDTSHVQELGGIGLAYLTPSTLNRPIHTSHASGRSRLSDRSCSSISSTTSLHGYSVDPVTSSIEHPGIAAPMISKGCIAEIFTTVGQSNIQGARHISCNPGVSSLSTTQGQEGGLESSATTDEAKLSPQAEQSLGNPGDTIRSPVSPTSSGSTTPVADHISSRLLESPSPTTNSKGNVARKSHFKEEED